MKKLGRSLLVALCVMSSLPAEAAPRDKAADKKIKEAVFTHFLNTDFDTAEGLLLGTVRACADQCSPAVLGRAWMYVGIVRGAGRSDMSGAKEAFKTAIATDPAVEIDQQVANDACKTAFAKLKGKSKGGEPSTPPPDTAETSAGITCAPAVVEVELRRPIPIQCEAGQDLEGMRLRYKAFNGGWASLTMTAEAGAFRATIPCTATNSTGTLRYYVEGIGPKKEVVAKLGTEQAPKTTQVVSESNAPPPAFPAEEPPARCGVDAAETPPGEHAEEPSVECKSDDDCSGASCTDGKCEKGEGPEDKTPAGPHAANLIGLHFGMDMAPLSVDNACAAASRADHVACFQGSTTYEGQPSPTGSGKVNGGLTLATMRALVSYERLFGSVGLEARLGFAFNGGKQPKGGTNFLPAHVEARLKYWILGEKAFTEPGLRPWVHLGGGLAQVDATVKDVEVADCTKAPDVNTCLASPDLRTAVFRDGATIIKVDATKQLGLMFITAGGGAMIAVGKDHGVVINVNAMFMLPSSGFVLEPSLGYSVGF